MENYTKIMEGVKETTAYPKCSHGTLGLISRPEAEWLHRIPKVLGPGIYVELGTFRGRSACIVGDTIQHMLNTVYITVDTFDDYGVNPIFHNPEIEDKYQFVLDLIESRGLSSFVKVLKSKTVEASAFFIDRTVNFLFIDADHSYEKAKADFYAWESKIKNGGIIAFHDSETAGVAQLLSEIAWKEIDRVETLSVWMQT